MPGWLQTLRNINPRLAEEAEKDLDRLNAAAITVIPDTRLKCDGCGCHPNVLHITDSGTYCQRCYNSLIKY